MRRLNLGSGIYPAAGYINIDIDPSVKPDVVRDLKCGLPFDSDSTDEVRAWHCLEHLDPEIFLFTMSEVWRVLKPSGLFDIQVPLGITDDPSHRVFFAEGSFNVFLDPTSQHYYRRGASWFALRKEVLSQKFPTLHLVLRKGSQ